MSKRALMGRNSGAQDVFIVGAGRVGVVLAKALSRTEHRVVGTWNRTAESAARVRAVTGLPAFHGRIPQVARGASLLLVCARDDALAFMAHKLVKDDAIEPGVVVAHSAGALDSTVLSPARCAGAAVGSLHPAASFSEGSTLPVGTHFAVEGDPEAVRVLRQVCSDLGGNPVTVDPGKKPAYHAALVFASNYVVALASIATDLVRAAGLDEAAARSLLTPLLEGTARNVSRGGVVEALTGPLTRGDLDTVRMHLAALRDDPELDLLYRALGRRALAVARQQGLPGDLAGPLDEELAPRR